MRKYVLPSFLFVLLQTMLAGIGLAQNTSSQTFNSSGTFTVPAGVTSVTVQLWGGGGAGVTGFVDGDGYAGGGGAFTQSLSIPVTVGATIPVTVGIGGTLSSSTGGTSSFGSFISAKGGQYHIGGAKEISGTYLSYSNNGGTGGTNGRFIIGGISFSNYFGGGGGAAGAANGENGFNGLNGVATNTTTGTPGAGGNARNGGGAGSKGGYIILNSSNVAGNIGKAPGGGGGGNKGAGASGRVIVTYTCAGPGAIKSTDAHTVPYPQELIPDNIRDSISTTGNGLTYSWQQSTDNVNWANTIPAVTDTKYSIPNISTTTSYRRVINSCAAINYTNAVQIKVFSIANGYLNGTISGQVISKNGIGVAGDSITIQKVKSLKGSPQTYKYTTATGADGRYEIQNIFYGDVNNGDSSFAVFTVTVSKAGHNFDSTNTTVTLTQVNNTATAKTFTDKTVFSITGQVTQTCGLCYGGSKTDYVAGVSISAPNATFTTTNASGNFSGTVPDPGTYTLTPSLKGHSFSPATKDVTVVNADVSGVAFADNTSRKISGVFKAGCNEYIGIAVLEFSDDVGTRTVPVFTKRVTTKVDGTYTITLPARSYRVKVISYTTITKGVDTIKATDLLQYINYIIPKDSLTRSIDTADATLDLIYHRPPVLALTGVNNICIANGGFDVWQQLDKKPIKIDLYEGSVIKGCRLASNDSVTIETTVQTDNNLENIKVPIVNGIANDTLLAGVPMVTGDYTKSLNIRYTDKYQRAATPILKKVVVTGTRAHPGSTFSTVSPQVPFMVLHDPAGDRSYSFWETSKSIEQAWRFYTKNENSENSWANVKVGADFSAGAFVTVESKVWASESGNSTTTSRNSSDEEAIVTTTTNRRIETSGDENVTGSQGDVFYGAAFNIIYAIADEVSVNACIITKQEKLILAPDSIRTEFIYTTNDVNNNIAELKVLAASFPDSAAKYNNQVSVWQQMLANNENNKKNAAYAGNLTFTGGGQKLDDVFTTSSSLSNNIEFDLEIDNETAAELGLEVAGNGVSGGSLVGFRMETGSSLTNTVTNTTTTGYHLEDGDINDKFTVNLKKDPVYNTTIFETVAGLSSCPAEESTIARDEMQIVTDGPTEITGIPADQAAAFNLICTNVSVDAAPRSYNLYLVNNPGGALVTSGANPLGGAFGLPIVNIGKGLSQIVPINVRKNPGQNTSFDYRDLTFILADNCSNTVTDINVSRSQAVSVSFISPCSNINLAQPANNWIKNATSGNSIDVLFDGYTWNALQTVSLEYATAGSGVWSTGFVKNQNEINNGIGGTTVPWNISFLADGSYDLRLKLVCASGVVYSKTATGTIDRNAPALFGSPEPTDDNYVAGDVISMSYTETIDNTSLSSNKVELRRLSNNSIIPVQVSGFGNKLVVVPTTPITIPAADSMILIVKNITDIYGNQKTNADTSRFTIGYTVIGSGPKALNVSVVNPALREDNAGTMDIQFTLPSPAANDTRVNYTIAGSATFSADYTVSYSANQPLITGFNGAQGTIVILKDSTKAVLKIDPLAEGSLEPDETIIITLSSGGDYTLGSSTSGTAIILNDDLAAPVITANKPTTFCTGDSTVLSTASGYTYLWSTGATTQSITVKTSGSYTVTISDVNGFTGTSAPTVVTVNTRPNPFITGAPVICSGIPAILNAGAGYVSYLWSNGVTTQTNSVTAAGIYTVTVTNASGCSATSAPDTVKTSTKPVPVISASGSTNNVCPGQSITLDAGAGAAAYLWSTAATTRTIVVSTAGSYTVTVTNTAGCSGTSAAAVVTYQTCAKPTGSVVSNIAKTTATLSWTPPATCATGYQVQYRKLGTTTWTTLASTTTSVNITGLTAATIYEWRLQTVCVQTPFTGSGYIAGSNFTTTTLAAVFAGTSVESSTVAGGFKAMVYPNPAKNSALLKVSGIDKEMTVMITEVMGKVLWKSAKLNTSQVQLPVAQLTAGVYLVTVTSGTKSFVVKMVKE